MKPPEIDEKLTEKANAGDKNAQREILKFMQSAGQDWLSDEEFNKHYEIGKKIALDRDDGEDLTMQIWLFGRHYDPENEDDRDIVQPCLLVDWPPEDKYEAMAALGAKFAEDHPNHMLVTAVLVSEAWMVQRPEEDADKLKGFAPSEQPDRIEVVQVSALSLDQRHAWFSSKIMRDENGKFVKFETLFEELHDPNEPKLPSEMQDRLLVPLFMGKLGMSLKGKKNGKTK